MKQILLDNAYVSWRNAIQNHDKIMQGYASLHNKKAFVSSLHNAIELFFKQIMLDSNNHEVATLRIITDEHDAQLALQYYQSSNLNYFFSSLPPDDLEKFNSIGFDKIIKSHRKIIGDSIAQENISKPLRLLQSLRNRETHFIIRTGDYLPERDFVVLHNFMVLFFQIAIECRLFPNARVCYEDNTYHLYDEEELLDFSRPVIESLSYICALKSNALFSEILRILQSEKGSEYAYHGSNNYELARYIVADNPSLGGSLDDVFTILLLMSQYGLFEVYTSVEEVTMAGMETYQNREDHFVFHF